MFLSPTFFGREKNKMIFFGKDRGSRNDQSPLGGDGNFSGNEFSQEKVGICRRLGKNLHETSRRIGGAGNFTDWTGNSFGGRRVHSRQPYCLAKLHLVDDFRLNSQQDFATILRNPF